MSARNSSCIAENHFGSRRACFTVFGSVEDDIWDLGRTVVARLIFWRGFVILFFDRETMGWVEVVGGGAGCDGLSKEDKLFKEREGKGEGSIEGRSIIGVRDLGEIGADCVEEIPDEGMTSAGGETGGGVYVGDEKDGELFGEEDARVGECIEWDELFAEGLGVWA